MKKIISIVYLAIFISFFSYADETIESFEAFRQLSTKQQIQYLLSNYKNAAYWNTMSALNLMLIMQENPETDKSILFKYFAEINPVPDRERTDWSYEIIQSLLWFYFYGPGLLTESEVRRMVELFQEKIDYYLKRYKRIDNTVIWFEEGITLVKTGKHIGIEPDYRLRDYIYRKYKDLGYEIHQW